MKQRLISLIFVIFLLMTMGVSAFAAPTPMVELKDSSEQSNGKIAVAVELRNNPGIWGCDFTVSYDHTALTLESVDNGDFFIADEWTPGNLYADSYILSYQNDALDENINIPDGTLAVLNFEIKEDAPTGQYKINISHKPGDVINIDLEDINFTPNELTVEINEQLNEQSNTDGALTTENDLKFADEIATVGIIEKQDDGSEILLRITLLCVGVISLFIIVIILNIKRQREKNTRKEK